MTDQLRRCVRSVSQKRAAAAGRRVPSPADTSAAFAICTKSLQDKGYLVPGTHRPTLLGLQRWIEMVEEPDHADKMVEYEAQLESDRMARMLDRIRRHQATRRGKQGAANRAGSLGRAGTISAVQADLSDPPRTPAEAVAQLQPLRSALEDVFACDTAYGDCRPDHPSSGHCFLAAMMVQDLLGGEIIAGHVDSIPHYWTRVPIPNARGGDSGKFLDVDITGDQFDKAAVQAKKGSLYRGGTAFARKPGEYLGQAGNKKVMKLYCKLRGRVVPILKKQGQADIAERIEATG